MRCLPLIDSSTIWNVAWRRSFDQHALRVSHRGRNRRGRSTASPATALTAVGLCGLLRAGRRAAGRERKSQRCDECVSLHLKPHIAFFRRNAIAFGHESTTAWKLLAMFWLVRYPCVTPRDS